MALTKNVLATAGLFMLGGTCFLTLGPAGYAAFNALMINATLTTLGLALYKWLVNPASSVYGSRLSQPKGEKFYYSPTSGRHKKKKFYSTVNAVPHGHKTEIVYTNLNTPTFPPSRNMAPSSLPLGAQVTKSTPVVTPTPIAASLPSGVRVTKVTPTPASASLPSGAQVTKFTSVVASKQPSLPPAAIVTKVTPAIGYPSSSNNTSFLPSGGPFTWGNSSQSANSSSSIPSSLASKLPPGAVVTNVRKV